jgi:hypothetical protein
MTCAEFHALVERCVSPFKMTRAEYLAYLQHADGCPACRSWNTDFFVRAGCPMPSMEEIRASVEGLHTDPECQEDLNRWLRENLEPSDYQGDLQEDDDRPT